jgi:predicted secreted protein
MKRVILILVLSSLAVACGLPQPPVPKLPTPEVLEQVVVAVGEVFTIPLTANPSTGFDWTVKHDAAMVEYLGHDCSPGRMPPAPGDQSHCGYKFKALTRGETKITLLYEQGKERGFAVSTVLEIVEVPVTIR